MEGEIARPAALTRCRVSTLVYLPPVPSSYFPCVAAFVCHSLGPVKLVAFLKLKHKKKSSALGQELFTTTQDVSHFSLQLVSQDSARELFNRLMTLPYHGVSRIEFHVCCLWIPVVRQGVDSFDSVGLGCPWTFTVIIFNDQCDSTLFLFRYISFA
jgi:hypothetical protein